MKISPKWIQLGAFWGNRPLDTIVRRFLFVIEIQITQFGYKYLLNYLSYLCR